MSINSTAPLTHLDDKLIQRIMSEYKIHNCELLFKEDSTIDDLIDVIEVGDAGLTLGFAAGQGIAAPGCDCFQQIRDVPEAYSLLCRSKSRATF